MWVRVWDTVWVAVWNWSCTKVVLAAKGGSHREPAAKSMVADKVPVHPAGQLLKPTMSPELMSMRIRWLA